MHGKTPFSSDGAVARGTAVSGRRAGPYELIDLLGRGGMGEVWRARHVLLGREAAVKLIRPELAEKGDASFERFHREARATSALRSPHTVEVYDFGVTEDGAFYYAMELLRGIDLRTLVARHGPVEVPRAIHLIKGVCASLEEAHGRGLLHRDIKPANVFTCQLGSSFDVPKVLDFGLVTAVAGDVAGIRLTASHVVVGSPAFMAPELASGTREVDGRADLYALGCVLYWLLTGRLVFEADTAMAMVMAQAAETPEPPSARCEVPIPAALDDVVLRCLEKKPDQRFASAEDLHEALSEVPVEAPWTETRARQWWRVHAPEVAESDREGVALTPTRADAAPTSPSKWGRAIGLLAAGGAVCAVALAWWVPWETVHPQPVASPLISERTLIGANESRTIFGLALSTKGERMAFVDQEGLWVGPVEGGAPEQLMVGELWGAQFFDDDQRILTTGHSDDRAGIWSVPLAGEPTLIAEGNYGLSRVSPDGSEIAALDERGLWTMPREGGPPRLVKPAGPEMRLGAFVWSPSSEHLAAVAFNYHLTNEGLEIVTRDGSSSRRVPIPGVAQMGAAMAWIPPDRLLYTRWDGSSTTLHAATGASDAPGEAFVEAAPIHRWSGMAIGFLASARDGSRLVFVEGRTARNVHVGALDDPQSLRPVAQTSWVDRPFGWWGPDTALFLSSRGDPPWGLYSRDLALGDTKLVAEGRIADGDRLGDALVVVRILGEDADRLEGAIRLLDPLTGHETEWLQLAALLPTTPFPPGPWSVRCATGFCLLGVYDGRQLRLSVLQPGGEPVEARFPVLPGTVVDWDVAPDGDRLAAIDRKENGLLLGGTDGRLDEIQVAMDSPQSVRWSHDGKRLFVTGFWPREASEPYALLSVEPGGVQELLFASGTDWMTTPIPSPDGKRLLLGTRNLESEVTVIDGLLPPPPEEP